MAKTVKVQLDKERTLAYPLMSLIKLKKEHGIELKDLADEEKSEDIEVILAIIWAGLIHEDRDMSMEDVGYMIDIAELPVIAEKLGEVFKGINEGKNLKQ